MPKPLKLSEARLQTPPASGGVGEWASTLRAAAFDAVTRDDITDLMRSILEKAKSGDLRAAKLILDYLTGRQPRTSPSPVTQQVMVVQSDRDSPPIEDLRQPVLYPTGHPERTRIDQARKQYGVPPHPMDFNPEETDE